MIDATNIVSSSSFTVNFGLVFDLDQGCDLDQPWLMFMFDHELVFT